MAKFTTDTDPPGPDPELRVGINEHKYAGLNEGVPQPPAPTLRPGTQYIDPRTGCVTTVLTEKAQRIEDEKLRNRHRADLARGLDSERANLAATRASLAELEQRVAETAKALKALGQTPTDMTRRVAAERRAVRVAWMQAVDQLESQLATVNDQVECVKTQRALLAAA